MLLARVQGHANSTIKHASLEGAKMLLAQPVRSLTIEPLLVLDRLGASSGDFVIITSDGQFARGMLEDTTSPARWSVVGIVDEKTANRIGRDDVDDTSRNAQGTKKGGPDR